MLSNCLSNLHLILFLLRTILLHSDDEKRNQNYLVHPNPSRKGKINISRLKSFEIAWVIIQFCWDRSKLSQFIPIQDNQHHTMNPLGSNHSSQKKADKEALAAEIRRIEAELERRKLEDEIRKLEQSLGKQPSVAKPTDNKKVVTTSKASAPRTPYAPNQVMRMSLGNEIKNAALKRTPESKMETIESVSSSRAQTRVTQKPNLPPKAKTSIDKEKPPVVLPPRSSLLAGISQAAADREKRLEDTGGKHQMREHTPEVQQQQKGAPQLSFDMAELITKKAMDREKRLADGGEKKMTKIKEKEEYRVQFTDICAEAAKMGRMTRLNEHSVEAVAGEKTPEQEWKSNGLLAINWRSNYMSVIQEAANFGNQIKMPEKIVSNDPNEMRDVNLDIIEKPMSPRMRQLLELNQKVGEGGHKLDHFVHSKKEELKPDMSMIVRPMKTYSNIEDVVLPRPAPPRYDPRKQRENLKKYAKHVDRPLQSIGNDVAARAWERRARLDRPNALPKMKRVCDCAFCATASPYQTYAYKVIEERRKAGLPVHIADPETESRLKREAQRAARRETRRKLKELEDQRKQLEIKHVETLNEKLEQAENELKRKTETTKSQTNSSQCSDKEEKRTARREARRQLRAAKQVSTSSISTTKTVGDGNQPVAMSSPKSPIKRTSRNNTDAQMPPSPSKSVKSTKSRRSGTQSKTIGRPSPVQSSSKQTSIQAIRSETKATKLLPPQKASKTAACIIM